MEPHSREFRERAEAASAEIRRAETLSNGPGPGVSYAAVGRDMATAAVRAPSVIEEMISTAMRLCERADIIGERLRSLGDRAYGEQPPTSQKGEDVRPAPPYGGQAAELYYTLSRLEDMVANAERAVDRVDGLA